MDVRETVPCYVDGWMSGGRLLQHATTNAAASSSSLTTSQQTASSGRRLGDAAIAKPQVRSRSHEWSQATADVEWYQLPSKLMVQKAPPKRRLIYIADAYDEYWVARTAANYANSGLGLATGRSAGKTGASPQLQRHATDSATAASPSSILTVSVLEDIFTALELAAFEQPELATERVTFQHAAEFLSASDTFPTYLTEAVRTYWIAKRHACGNVPLMPALWRHPSNDSTSTGCGGLCSADVLGDCPLPFIRRDGPCHSVIRTAAHTCTKRQREELEEDVLSAAEELADAMFQREVCAIDSMTLTLYELAMLRSGAVERMKTGS